MWYLDAMAAAFAICVQLRNGTARRLTHETTLRLGQKS